MSIQLVKYRRHLHAQLVKAIEIEHESAIRSLLEHIDINTTITPEGQTALELATTMHISKVVKILLEYPNSDSVKHQALKKVIDQVPTGPHWEIIKLLFESKPKQTSNIIAMFLLRHRNDIYHCASCFLMASVKLIPLKSRIHYWQYL